MNKETKIKIMKIMNSADGMNIGTSLQEYMEENIKPILPVGIDYWFEFNMSGETKHHFIENGIEINPLIQ